MTTRKQHYVWRHYLEAWQNEDGLVYCARNGAILPPTNPRNIMAERDFYKLSQITEADMSFLKAFIELTGVALRESHRELVVALAHIANANERIQSSDIASVAEKHYAQTVAIEIEEKLQGRIEEHAVPLLEELRQKRSEFINTDETAMAFFDFLAHQYFRTKGIRESFKEALSKIDPNHDFARLANIVCHIGAVNFGGSLFVDRNEFDIVFLDDRDEAGFITGDQPIVNLMGTGDGREVTQLALYYPLGPVLSCLVVPREYKLRSSSIPRAIVKELNDLIAWKSRDFLVANSISVLQHIVSKPSLTGSPAGRIFDSLVKTSRL